MLLLLALFSGCMNSETPQTGDFKAPQAGTGKKLESEEIAKTPNGIQGKKETIRWSDGKREHTLDVIIADDGKEYDAKTGARVYRSKSTAESTLKDHGGSYHKFK